MILPLHAGHAAGHADPWTAWSADWPVIGAALVALALFLAGWRRLRRRGRADLASGARAAAFCAGLALIVLAVASPLDEVGEEYLLWGHMAQHLLLADVGPLLLALAVAGPLSLFVVPRPLLRGVARARPLRRALRLLARPWTALAIWTAVMAGWHVPAAYEYALAHRWAHDLEHATMLAAGLLVWVLVLGVIPGVRLGEMRRAGLAVGVLVAGVVISQVLFLSDPLYDVYVEQPERLLGLSPEADQARAAIFMGTEQLLTLGAAAGLLLWAHLERVAARPLEAPGGEA